MRAEIWSLAFWGVRKQMKIDENGESSKIDLCPDMAAILNQTKKRSIMGCPGGTRSVFTCAFVAKRELQCIFLGKMAIIITPKQGTKIFSHYNLFLILGDPGAVSRVGRKGATKVFKYGRKSPWVPTLTELFPKIQADAGS